MRRELAGLKQAAEVSSSGTGAWEGAPASEGALLIGLENDLDLSRHLATVVSRERAEKADLILTMARHHRTRVEELGGAGKTHLLGEYGGKAGADAEVSDPFGQDLAVYRGTFAEIEQLVKKAVARIVGTPGGSDTA